MGNRRAPTLLFPLPVVRVGGRGPRFCFLSCNSAYSLAFLLVLLRPSESFLSGTRSGEAGQALEGVLGSTGSSLFVCLGFWSFHEPGGGGDFQTQFPWELCLLALDFGQLASLSFLFSRGRQGGCCLSTPHTPG